MAASQSFRCFAVAIFILSQGPNATAGEVTLTRGEHTVVVRIDGEVSCALTVDPHWSKPYIQPVAVAGSWEILAENLANPPADEFAAGGQLFVVTEGAEIRAFDAVQGRASYGEILTANEVKEGFAYIPDREGWIALGDVVPVAAMITRIVNESPPEDLEREHPLFYDHPHHKGIWNTLDEINGINFWGEGGVVRNVELEIVQPSGTAASLRMINHWIDANNEPVLIETTTVTFFDNRLYVFDIELAAGANEVTFGDTKEGMLAIRVPNSMREFIGGGPIVNSDGLVGTAECWGKTADWVDYIGPIDGRTFGVTLMDHPDNFHPSRYHVRDYGLFSINPFGDNAYTNGELPEVPFVLTAGDSVAMRYGLFVHRDGTEAGGVAQAYQQFVSVE
jgi:hypothetical protein